MERLILIATLLTLSGFVTQNARAQEPAGRWSKERAERWAEKTGWLVGCNFSPGTAINQLEMWQADTFDPKTIDRELGWAADLGFNSIRVYLHNLPWDEDKEGFLERIDAFLTIADKHDIGVMFVLFDSVWDPFPKAGKQREPKPHVHNSGWVQCPSLTILKDPSRHDEMKPFVQGVISHFRDDKRVHVWDLYNEPENRNNRSYGKHEPENKAELCMKLLVKTFTWAREVDPSQPLTSAPWTGDWSSHEKLSPLNRFMLDNSDVITFHRYSDLEETKKRVAELKRYDRPMICTEYMARPQGSTFKSILTYFKRENIGAYNWGLVDGKTQTIYPWDSWDIAYTDEPPVWFHDIFRRDGTPYIEEEVETIRALTGAKHTGN